MTCSSTGRTLALERATRRATTKGFPCGFPSPNADRAASKRCTSSVASAETLSGGRLADCRGGTSQADFCCRLVKPPNGWLTALGISWTLRLLANFGPLVRLGPRTSNDLHPTVQNWCSLPSSSGLVLTDNVPGDSPRNKIKTKPRLTDHAKAMAALNRNGLSQNGYGQA